MKITEHIKSNSINPEIHSCEYCKGTGFIPMDINMWVGKYMKIDDSFIKVARNMLRKYQLAAVKISPTSPESPQSNWYEIVPQLSPDLIRQAYP